MKRRFAWVVFGANVLAGIRPLDAHAAPAFEMKRVSNVVEAWADFDPRAWDVAGNKRILAAQKQLGFDTVRIGVRPSFLPNFQNPADEASLSRLRETVQAALDLDLKVIVELATGQNDTVLLLNENELTPKFEEFVHRVWRIAKFVGEFPPERVAIEPISQPNDGSPKIWQKHLQYLWQKCRDAAPKHTIILDGPDWSSLEGLEFFPPISDGNTYAAFYFYEPLPFTHQGAEWAPSPIPLLRSVPFPVTDAGMDTALADSFSRLAHEKKDVWRNDPSRMKSLVSSILDSLSEYAQKKYDRESIARRFEKAAAWSATKKIPLFLAGFGVRRGESPRADAVLWYRAVRESAEKAKIAFAPWFFWSYQRRGAQMPDDDLLEALQLNTSSCSKTEALKKLSGGDNPHAPTSVSYITEKLGADESRLKISWKCPASTSGFVSWSACKTGAQEPHRSAEPSGELTITGKSGEDFWLGVVCSDAPRVEEAPFDEAERSGFAVRIF